MSLTPNNQRARLEVRAFAVSDPEKNAENNSNIKSIKNIAILI